MKKLPFKIILLLLICCASCSVDSTELTEEQKTRISESFRLEEMFTNIQKLSLSVTCTDPSEWRFVGYGSKSCGGPMGYVAYSTEIDTESFLELIEEQKIAQREYNEKYNIASDCALAPVPTGIKCENGRAVLVY